MDEQVVREKLESIRRCVKRIETTRVDSADALMESIDAQDILTLNLTRAVQLCADVAVHVLARGDRSPPASMGDAMMGLASASIVPEDLAKRLRAAVGFRNLAVHAYHEVDWAIVHRLTYDGVEDFRDFAGAVARHLEGGVARSQDDG